MRRAVLYIKLVCRYQTQNGVSLAEAAAQLALVFPPPIPMVSATEGLATFEGIRQDVQQLVNRSRQEYPFTRSRSASLVRVQSFLQQLNHLFVYHVTEIE